MSTQPQQPHSLVWDGQPDHEPREGQWWYGRLAPGIFGPRGPGEIADPRRCYDSHPAQQETYEEAVKSSGMTQAQQDKLMSYTNPAPAGGKGVEELQQQCNAQGEVVGKQLVQISDLTRRLLALEQSHANLQQEFAGDMVDTAQRLRAIESHPALSVQAVEVPGHKRVTTPEQCQQTPGSFHHDPAGGALTINPASPQRTPAEVGGGESVGAEQARWQNAIYSLLSATMKRLPRDAQNEMDGAGCESSDPLDVTLSEIRQCLGAYQDALSTAPRGKVLTRERIAQIIQQNQYRAPQGCESWHYAAADQIITEGNAHE